MSFFSSISSAPSSPLDVISTPASTSMVSTTVCSRRVVLGEVA